MAHAIIRHRVKDYDTWKAGFDDFAEQRRAGGETAYEIFRPQDDPDNLILHFEWDSLENARAFMDSAALKEAMERAGVLETPEIHLADRADSGTP